MQAVRQQYCAGVDTVTIRVIVGIRVRVRVRLGLRENCNVSDPGIKLGDGVCDFELYPSAKRG